MITCLAIAAASCGGSAFPICRNLCVLLPKICHSLGNPCNLAVMSVVSLGLPSKSGGGGASAIPKPSTPNAAHCALARVGPRSGPPCLRDPPTIVGAGLLAIPTQSSTPDHPSSPIMLPRASPTVSPCLSSPGQNGGGACHAHASRAKPARRTCPAYAGPGAAGLMSG